MFHFNVYVSIDVVDTVVVIVGVTFVPPTVKLIFDVVNCEATLSNLSLSVPVTVIVYDWSSGLYTPCASCHSGGVISAKNPKPDLLMLDKQLAYAEYIGIKSIIVINKIDLDEKKVNEIKEIYKNVGYKIIETNAKEKEGIEKLKNILENNISVFSGNSGVGKSTLLNDIFNEEKTKEGLISDKNKRGKNTTTNISLYKINENEYIADTPRIFYI